MVVLYTTGTINPGKYDKAPLLALLAAPPPPPPAAAPTVAPRTRPTRPKLSYTQGKLIAPASIPKTVSPDNSAAAPDVGGVVGGVPAAVARGQLGGSLAGVLGGTGPT